MKFGDLVIYNEFGQDYPALVVSSRDLEHHGGAFDEPLLNLVFVSPVKDGSGAALNVSGTAREVEQVQFRHDVAHDSHEFTDEQKEDLAKKGLLPPGGSVAGGRWRQGEFRVHPVEFEKLAKLSDAKAQKQLEAEALKAEAEKKAANDAAKSAEVEEEKAIEREAKIRLKQEELKAKAPEPVTTEPESADPDKGGNPSPSDSGSSTVQ